MPKYRVNGRVFASTHIGDVEAESVEDAMAKAEALADVGLCNQCSDKVLDPEVEIDVSLVELLPDEDDDSGGTP